MKFWINQTPPKNNFSGSRLFLLKALSFYGNPKQKLSIYHVPILCYRNSHERVQLPISTSIYLPTLLEFLLFVFLFSKHNLAKSFKVPKFSRCLHHLLRCFLLRWWMWMWWKVKLKVKWSPWSWWCRWCLASLTWR